MIYRSETENGNFVTINKDLVNDYNLSSSAKGVMLYILSKYDDWQFYETEITTHFSDGKKKIHNAIIELIEKGYITREQHNNKKGYFEYEYKVYETKNAKEQTEN